MPPELSNWQLIGIWMGVALVICAIIMGLWATFHLTQPGEEPPVDLTREEEK